MAGRNGLVGLHLADGQIGLQRVRCSILQRARPERAAVGTVVMLGQKSSGTRHRRPVVASHLRAAT